MGLSRSQPCARQGKSRQGLRRCKLFPTSPIHSMPRPWFSFLPGHPHISLGHQRAGTMRLSGACAALTGLCLILVCHGPRDIFLIKAIIYGGDCKQLQCDKSGDVHWPDTASCSILKRQGATSCEMLPSCAGCERPIQPFSKRPAVPRCAVPWICPAEGRVPCTLPLRLLDSF